MSVTDQIHYLLQKIQDQNGQSNTNNKNSKSLKSKKQTNFDDYFHSSTEQEVYSKISSLENSNTNKKEEKDYHYHLKKVSKTVKSRKEKRKKIKEEKKKKRQDHHYRKIGQNQNNPQSKRIKINNEKDINLDHTKESKEKNIKQVKFQNSTPQKPEKQIKKITNKKQKEDPVSLSKKRKRTDDDNEILRLEKLLGQGKKNKSKINQDLSSDGLFDLFSGLTSAEFYDEENEDLLEENEENQEDLRYEDDSDNEMDTEGGDDIEEIEDDQEDQDGDQEDQDGDQEDQDGDQEVSNEKTDEKKYIPPHLRRQLQQTSTHKKTKEISETETNQKRVTQLTEREKERQIELNKKITGILNKLSESNIISLSDSLFSLFTLYPRAVVTDSLVDNITQSLKQTKKKSNENNPSSSPSSSTTTSNDQIVSLIGLVNDQHRIIINYSAILSLLSLSLSSSSPLTKPTTTTTTTTTESDSSITTTGSESKLISLLIERLCVELNESYIKKKAECGMYLLLFIYLYKYSLISSVIIFDLIYEFISNWSPISVELIILVLKECGPQLRSDDPLKLKDIALQIHEQSKPYTQTTNKSTTKTTPRTSNNDNGGEGDGDGDDDDDDNENENYKNSIQFQVRNSHCVSVIIDITSNKKKLVVPDKNYTSLSSLVKRLKNEKKVYISPLPMSWKDLLSVEENGRWWLVGSSWKPKQKSKDGDDGDGDGDRKERNNKNSSYELTFSEELLQLARKHRMNTDIRKAIFCSVMLSEDYMDAFEKLMKLNLKNKQDREIVYVLLYLTAQEKKVNMFYVHLLIKLCSYDKNYKFTLQYSFWDRFKAFSTTSQRSLINLSQLLGHLIGSGSLSLSVLKVIEWQEGSSNCNMFLKSLFITLITQFQKRTVEKAFQRISGNSETQELSKNISFFLSYSLKDIASSSNEIKQKIDSAKIILKNSTSSTASDDPF